MIDITLSYTSSAVLALTVRGLWMSAESLYRRGRRVAPGKDWEISSGRVWDISILVGMLGLVIGFTSIGQIEYSREFLGWCGIALLLTGIALRWVAIYTLGEFFTYTITIKDAHRIVNTGLYRWLRHPSYTGALLAYFGLGLAFVNWLSLALVFLPMLGATLYRIPIEEQALTERFGNAYEVYRRGTRRLIPKIY